MNRQAVWFFSIYALLSTGLYAMTLVIPPTGNIVGNIEYGQSEPGETLDEVGLRYGIGYGEMIKANPRVDRIHPLSPQTQLFIPSQFILQIK